MRKAAVFDNEQLKKLNRLRKTRMTDESIAEEIGMPVNKMKRIIQRMLKAGTLQPRKPEWTAAQWEEFRVKCATHRPMVELLIETGLSKSEYRYRRAQLYREGKLQKKVSKAIKSAENAVQRKIAAEKKKAERLAAKIKASEERAAKIREREKRKKALVRIEEMAAAKIKPQYTEDDLDAAMREAYRLAGIRNATYR
ncbi:MAG: hypothetical protein HGA87_00065 [Desulfobulbaceae bacterium]|nr:hypothetical protein [Desulfobulbaceae bacterium]